MDFESWFYQDSMDTETGELRMVNFWDALSSEFIRSAETMMQMAYSKGYEQGWNDKEDSGKGLDA